MTMYNHRNTFDETLSDTFVSELGYQIEDLVPSVKHGPLGRINITFDTCKFTRNNGSIRSLYRYHEYSNTLWHFELKNNRFTSNERGVLKIYLPRIYRFAIKNHWQNTSHTLTIHNNEFLSNKNFDFKIDGYYAQINITQNTFTSNDCPRGLVHLTGAEKHFFIYSNRISSNFGHFIFELDAKSHADTHWYLESLFVDNFVESNQRPSGTESPHSATNAPTSYAIALRGLQNCTFTRNIFDNPAFDYEFIGAMTTNTLNSTIDATLNWWGTSNATLIKSRIFDMNEWNNHAIVNYAPYRIQKFDETLGKNRAKLSPKHSENILGGIVEYNLELTPSPQPYQVKFLKKF